MLSNVTGPAAVIPAAVTNVLTKVVAPLEFKVNAAPLPLPNEVILPTAPLKVVVAVPALIVKFWPPSTVLLKINVPLFVVNVVLAPNTTSLLYVCGPFVIILPPLRKVVSPTAKLLNGVVVPIAALNVML